MQCCLLLSALKFTFKFATELLLLLLLSSMALDTPPLLSNVVDSFEFTSSVDDSSVVSVLNSKSIDLKNERERRCVSVI